MESKECAADAWLATEMAIANDYAATNDFTPPSWLLANMR